jgi:hypothetical protein
MTTRPPPASEADLTPSELASAAADMERVLEQEPDLNEWGLGAADWRPTADERDAFVREYRKTIRASRSLASFIAARLWLSRFAKTKALNRRGSSYFLKHVAERDIGYLTNGVFIAAAIAEGFRVQRVGRDNANAWLNIASSALRSTP